MNIFYTWIFFIRSNWISKRCAATAKARGRFPLAFRRGANSEEWGKVPRDATVDYRLGIRSTIWKETNVLRIAPRVALIDKNLQISTNSNSMFKIYDPWTCQSDRLSKVYYIYIHIYTYSYCTITYSKLASKYII